MADETTEPTEEPTDAPIDWEAREAELLALSDDELEAVAGGMGVALSDVRSETVTAVIEAEQDSLPDDEPEDIDWEARESELLDLKADELKAMAAEMELSVSGTKAELTARIIAAEQDAIAAETDVDEELPDLDDDEDDTTPDAPAADDPETSDDADPVESSDEDVAVGDAMADEAAAHHERAHGMGVTATPGTVATLDPDRLVKPPKPAEAWDALAKNIQRDLEEQAGDLFEDAKDAAAFAGEFAQKLAKYKYKLATARDTFQKRQYAQNLKHLEAQMATEAARVKQQLVRDGDALLERILTTIIKTVTGAALGALI